MKRAGQKKYRIVHLVPYDGIGGVESAARSMMGVSADDVQFEVAFIADMGATRQQRKPSISGSMIIRTAWRYVKTPPDLLLVSLWRSAIIGIIAKALHPRMRLVLFLHSPEDVHFIDFITNKIAALLASEIWADSRATIKHRLPRRLRAKTRTISFLMERIEPVTSSHSPLPRFVFWGRLHQLKRLDRALRLFARVRERIGTATFQIIGPDGGQFLALEQLAADLGISDAVSFSGPMSFEEITRAAAQASFYLQTSAQEGMALSVVEAMQLGLVPVVTPVGEIGNYCRHMENSILIDEDKDTLGCIEAALGDINLYEQLRVAAIHTWFDKPLYRDSVMAASRAALEGR